MDILLEHKENHSQIKTITVQFNGKWKTKEISTKVVDLRTKSKIERATASTTASAYKTSKEQIQNQIHCVKRYFEREIDKNINSRYKFKTVKIKDLLK